MSDYNEEGVKMKSFSLTIFLAFVVGFCLFILMAQCHGNYRPMSEQPTTAGIITQ